MVSSESFFVACIVATLAFGGMFVVALALALHNLRRSRVAAFARRGSAAFTEGPALLGGVVEAADHAPPGPVLAVDVFAAPGLPTFREAHPFTLRLPSGAAVRVEPAEGQWSLDTTFVPIARSGQAAYSARVQAGQVVYVSGAVRREIDPAIAGTGYRDTARTWVMRGDLSFSSAAVVAGHAARARFHGAWATGLAGLLVAVQAVSPRSFHALHHVARRGADYDPLMLMVALVTLVALAYWHHAEASVLWVRRGVKGR